MMMGRRLRKRQGVTLIELLIVVLLISIVFIAGFSALMFTLRFFREEEAEHKASDHAAIAIDWIQKDALQANSIDTSTSNQLTLTITNYADLNHPVDTVEYYLSDSNTTLNRRYTTAAGTTESKLIIDIIDPDNLPVYQALAPNCLLIDIHTKDTKTEISARQRSGFMLRCRATTP
jgi:prepilin-type N-terminal cleavage/methylation domain-containing protein